MKYYKATLFNSGPPINLEDTEIVYCQAENEAELLPVALDLYEKPVKECEEVTKSIFDANQ